MDKCPFSGKLVYQTRRHARLALGKIGMRRASKHVERNAYRCPHCHGWHITREGERPGLTPPRLTPNRRWRWTGFVPEEE